MAARDAEALHDAARVLLQVFRGVKEVNTLHQEAKRNSLGKARVFRHRGRSREGTDGSPCQLLYKTPDYEAAAGPIFRFGGPKTVTGRSKLTIFLNALRPVGRTRGAGSRSRFSCPPLAAPPHSLAVFGWTGVCGACVVRQGGSRRERSLGFGGQFLTVSWARDLCHWRRVSLGSFQDG